MVEKAKKKYQWVRRKGGPLNLGEWFKIAVMSLRVNVVAEVDKRVRKK